MSTASNIKSISLLLLCTVLVLPWQACSGGQGQTEEKEPLEPKFSGARLVQVDSIMIDVTGNFKVYDYQPETQLFLGGDIKHPISIVGRSSPKSNQIGHIIFDRHGNIIHQFKNTHQGPNGHGTAAQSSFFLGPDAIGVFGLIGLYKYQLNGTLIKRYREINLSDVSFIGFNKSGFSIDGNVVALGLPKSVEGAYGFSDSLFQLVKPVKFYDLEKFEDNTVSETEKGKPISEYGYPKHPSYVPKLWVFGYPPLMETNVSDSVLFTLYSAIPKLTAYDLRSGQFKEEVDLNPDHFSSEVDLKKLAEGTQGFSWWNDGGQLANSRYHGLSQLGEYTLLRYSTAIPKSSLQLLMTNRGLQTDPNWPRIRKMHYQYYYQLFKNGEKVLPDFRLPPLEPREEHEEYLQATQIRGQIIGGNGLDEIFVFIPNNGEVERDYELIRVYKLELISEEDDGL